MLVVGCGRSDDAHSRLMHRWRATIRTGASAARKMISMLENHPTLWLANEATDWRRLLKNFVTIDAAR